MNPIACVWVPWFTAAAEVRCEPWLAECPLAIVRGTSPVTRVVDANAAARERGVAPGMMEAEARARCPELVRRVFSDEHVASARHALLEAALTVSPRIEDAGPGLVYVDTAGLERLFGDAIAIGTRLLRQVRTMGMEARVGIAGSRTAARIAAKSSTAPVKVLLPDTERAALAPTPLALLELSADLEVALGRWGVTTLGELAALPRTALTQRLGPAGLRAHDQALGRDSAPFRVYTPPPFWGEAQGLDWEIDDLGALVGVVRIVLERLAARLTAAHVWADGLDVHLELASGGRDERTIALAHPMQEPALMLTVLRFELEAHPPSAPVTGVALTAHPVLARGGQGGLWRPSGPRQRDLAALVARLVELVGPGNIGSPVVMDSHRPDAFTLAPFISTDGGVSEIRGGQSHLVVRWLRPARRVDVVVDGERPAHVDWNGTVVPVVARAGPWRASGDWWDSDAWARDEWDLLLHDGTLCRLARDRVTGHWTLDAIYD